MTKLSKTEELRRILLAYAHANRHMKSHDALDYVLKNPEEIFTPGYISASPRFKSLLVRAYNQAARQQAYYPTRLDPRRISKFNALDESIQKWEAIVAGNGYDNRAFNCALCQAYLYCKGCPVVVASKDTNCTATPYAAFATAAREELLKRIQRLTTIYDFKYLPHVALGSAIPHAKAMLTFLKGLQK